MRQKTLILIFGLTMFALTTEAQIKLGVRSNLILNDTEVISGAVDLDKTVKSMPGYSLGATAEYNLNENWSLNSELLYKHIGFQISESTSFGLFGLDVPLGATLKTTVNYLELPVLFKYRHDLGRLHAYVEAGPSMNYALNGKVKSVANSILDINITETDLNLSADSYKRINTAGNIGVGVMYPYSGNMTLTAGIRYTKDLSDSVELPIIDAGIKNNSLAIGASVAMIF